MTTTTTPTDLPRKRFARAYPKMAATAEQRGATEHRRRLLEGLQGRVVEIGAGHGLTFPLYPAAVTEVVALEPEPTLRARAEKAAADAPVPVRVLAGVADALPLDDAGFDAAVTSLVLCSVHDQQKVLGEIRRVLRPDGELRFYEHVIPQCQPRAPCCRSPITVACGPSSPAAATPPATPPPPSPALALRSRRSTGSGSRPGASTR